MSAAPPVASPRASGERPSRASERPGEGPGTLGVEGIRPSAGHADARRDLSSAASAASGGAPPPPRKDHLLVARMVEPGTRVLDVGCGDGVLLALLRDRSRVDGRGIELSRDGVSHGLARGLAVIQGDADTDLADYPDDSFDYVILSQTLQATRHPRVVLEHMLRIGRRAIVSFPNFGHWRVRWEIGVRGRMPVTDNLPHSWYETPNIHFCTMRDFVGLCRVAGATIEQAHALDADGEPVRFSLPWWVWNLFGQQGVFLLRRG